MKLLHFIFSILQYSLFCRQVIGNRYFYSDSESTIGKLSSFQNPEGRPAPRVAQVWVPRIGRGGGSHESCGGKAQRIAPTSGNDALGGGSAR